MCLYTVGFYCHSLVLNKVKTNLTRTTHHFRNCKNKILDFTIHWTTFLNYHSLGTRYLMSLSQKYRFLWDSSRFCKSSPNSFVSLSISSSSLWLFFFKRIVFWYQIQSNNNWPGKKEHFLDYMSNLVSIHKFFFKAGPLQI